MAYNFPDSPTPGQVFQKWTWNGEAWLLTPPNFDALYVNAAGDTMTGPLIVPDPTAPGHATNKNYVDTATPPPFPAGTVMLFYQAAAPTGWTKLTTQNDKALRVVSGSGGVAGGTNAFSTVMAQTVVGSFTNAAATQTNMGVSVSGRMTVYPNLNSGYYYPMAAGGWVGYLDWSGGAMPYNIASSNNVGITYSNYQQGDNSMSGGTTNGGGAAHNHTMVMGMQYIDIILASKN